MFAALLILASCRRTRISIKPAQLTPFSATLKSIKLWSARSADKGAKPLRLGLGLAAEGNRVYCRGSQRCTSLALDVATRTLRVAYQDQATISGGPGVGGDPRRRGLEWWRGHCTQLSPTARSAGGCGLNGEVLSAPAISERVVAVRTSMASCAVFHPRWARAVGRRSMHGTRACPCAARLSSPPVIVGDPRAVRF